MGRGASSPGPTAKNAAARWLLCGVAITCTAANPIPGTRSPAPSASLGPSVKKMLEERPTSSDKPRCTKKDNPAFVDPVDGDRCSDWEGYSPCRASHQPLGDYTQRELATVRRNCPWTCGGCTTATVPQGAVAERSAPLPGCGIGVQSASSARGTGCAFVVLHFAGEGSHHFVETLQHFKCVQVDVDERWDHRNFYPRGKGGFAAIEQIRMAAVLGFLWSKDVPLSYDTLGLTKGGQYKASAASASTLAHWSGRAKWWNDETARDCPAGVARGVLVRVSAQRVCDAGLQPILTVRTDLMRYALSNYPKEGHPQWVTNRTVKAKEYDIDVLMRTADHMISWWVETAKKIEELRACGLDPLLAQYEEISDDAEAAAANGVVAALEQKSGLKFPRREAQNETDVGAVVKVHSDHISSFATNFGAIYRHFRTVPYPTFAMVMASPEAGRKWLKRERIATDTTT